MIRIEVRVLAKALARVGVAPDLGFCLASLGYPPSFDYGSACSAAFSRHLKTPIDTRNPYQASLLTFRKTQDSSMADAASAPKPKVSKPKKPVEHPGFTSMITEAIAALKEVRLNKARGDVGRPARPPRCGMWGLRKLLS